MAVGYLSRALSRTSPTAGLSSVRAATRTRSPLAEEDQRLHDVPDLSAPGASVSPLTSAPGPAHPAMDPAAETVAPQAQADPVAAPLSEADSWVAGHAAAGEDDSAPAAVASSEPRAAGPLAHSAEATPSALPQTPTATPAPVEGPAPDPSPGGAKVDRSAPTATPEQVLSQALSQAQAWVAGGDDGVHEAAARELEGLFSDVTAPQGTPALPPSGTPMAQVEPILPVAFDMPLAAQAAPAAPQVEIGSIEVEIVPPAAAPKPAQAAPQRSQPSRPPPAPAVPYGWRQR